MDQEIDAAPFFGEGGEHRLDRCLVGDVAREHELGADLFGQRLDPLLDGLALIGEGDLGALIGHGLGDAPGDGAIIGNAEHEPAFACHQSAGLGH